MDDACTKRRRRWARAAMLVATAVAVGVVGSAGRDAAAAPRPPAPVRPVASPRPTLPRAAPDSALWLQMRDVDLHIDERAVLHIRRLHGQVVPTKAGEPPVLDDTHSFKVRVTSGEVSLTGPDLSVLLNKFVFNYRGAPLKRLRVRMAGKQLVQTGVLHKGVDVHFEITSTPTLEPDGRVKLHPTKTRILGVDGQKMLHALGLHLDDMLDLRKARGASVKGDDLFLDPTEILPPPAIEGRLASIRVEDDRIVQTFVRLPDDSVFGTFVRPDTSAANFVYFRGARLRFGKLLMTDTDLLIVDADATDAFDLNLEQYNRQLVASTSRTLPNLGLQVLMPDYRTVAHPRPSVAAPGAAAHH